MDNKTEPKLKMKLSLKKETLKTLNDSEIALLDGVVGGTGGGGNCTRTIINTQLAAE
jgi:hypothetical protein